MNIELKNTKVDIKSRTDKDIKNSIAGIDKTCEEILKFNIGDRIKTKTGESEILGINMDAIDCYHQVKMIRTKVNKDYINGYQVSQIYYNEFEWLVRRATKI